MRGSRAKMLRRMAYDPPTMKYAHSRLYTVVRSPGQGELEWAGTIIADEQRYLYQTLKGRRPYNVDAGS
jgi:hypothetical protein